MARQVDEVDEQDVEQDEEEDYRKAAAKNRKEKLQGKWFTLPEGDTTFRILKTPPDKQRKSRAVWMEYYVHRNVGPKKRTKRCGLSVVDDSGSCWLCNKVESLKEKGETKLAEDLEKSKTYAVQIAVWDEQLEELRGPMVWAMGAGGRKSMAFRIESVIANEKKDYLDHKNGYNFTVNRQGTGFKNTEYGPLERNDEPTAVPKQIIAKLKPFADVIDSYDAESQKQSYFGRDEDEDTGKGRGRGRDEEEEEAPRARRKPVDEDEDEEPTPRKKKPVVDEDEDEEPAPRPKKKPVVDEDEDEEPAPRARKKPAADEDEEENLFADEEDEAPTPKKKKPAVDEDEEEPAPRPKRKAVVDEDEDEEPAPKPKKKVAVVDEDEDEEPAPKPKKKVVVEDEDEEEPAPRPKKKPSYEEDEDDLNFGDDDEPAPKPKKKAVVDEDEDEEPAPKRRGR